MQARKFIKSYKCDCFQPDNYCNCKHRTASSDVLIENVNDTAESLIEIMKLCGISMPKDKEISDVIIYFFLHFEEITHRIDSIPRKRLNKEDVMYDLARKCSMNRHEAQMAYSIIKRAFRAFYYGTDLGGVPNILLKDKLAHTSECLWVHAAQRTAQAYAAYEGIFRTAQKDLECKIKFIYKQLYDRISRRDQQNDNFECSCIKCIKRIGKETLKSVESIIDLHVLDHPFEGVYLKEQEKYIETQTDESGSEKRKIRCSCPSLLVTNIDGVYCGNIETAKLGSSQESFACEWISISKEEFDADEADVKLKDETPFSPRQSVERYFSDHECTCEDCSCTSDFELACEDEFEKQKEFVNEEISLPSDTSSISIYGIYDNAILAALTPLPKKKFSK